MRHMDCSEVPGRLTLVQESFPFKSIPTIKNGYCWRFIASTPFFSDPALDLIYCFHLLYLINIFGVYDTLGVFKYDVKFHDCLSIINKPTIHTYIPDRLEVIWNSTFLPTLIMIYLNL